MKVALPCRGQRAELADLRLETCLAEPLRAALRPLVDRVVPPVAFLVDAFLVDAFFAALLLGLVGRREERVDAFLVDAFLVDAFFAVLLLGVFLLGLVEVARPVLGRDALECALDRFRISPTTEPTMPAPATASIGFSLTADAALFVPLAPVDAALPTTLSLREITSVPPRAARCTRPPTA
jgi:hypothetical protein